MSVSLDSKSHSTCAGIWVWPPFSVGIIDRSALELSSRLEFSTSRQQQSLDHSQYRSCMARKDGSMFEPCSSQIQPKALDPPGKEPRIWMISLCYCCLRDKLVDLFVLLKSLRSTTFLVTGMSSAAKRTIYMSGPTYLDPELSQPCLLRATGM